jgi:predicted glutamine amidotransferase
MCQLCFINCNDPSLNAALLVNASIINSQGHKDGWGFYWGGFLYKSSQCPSDLIDIGILISKHKTIAPIISHVRRASVTYGAKKNDNKFSHPFEGERFILAHNGTLESKNEAYMNDEKFKDMIDSQIFHYTLEESAKKNPKLSFEKLMKTVTDMFYGKFAFLVFDKLDSKYYALRGDTADLHYADLFFMKNKEQVTSGYIINTEKQSLSDLLLTFNNNIQVCRAGIYLDWDKLNIKLLEKNSIFLLGDTEIKKVGEVEQTTKPVKVWEHAQQGWSDRYNQNYNQGSFSTAGKNQEAIFTFIRDWDISILYLDEWLYKLYSKPLLGLEYKEIKDFVERVIPLYVMKDRKRIKIVNVWKTLKNAYKVRIGTASDVGIHVARDIIFPYFDNDGETLRKHLINIKNIVIENKSEETTNG